MEFEQVERVVTIILSYIEQSGGLLDDQPGENVPENSPGKQKPASEKEKMIFLITFSDSSTEIFYSEYLEAFHYARSKSDKFPIETSYSEEITTSKKSNPKDRMNASSGFPKVIKRKDRDKNNPNDRAEEN